MSINIPSISIIIPTKDRGKILDKTIETAIDAISDLQAEIIVINDSKTSIPVIPPNNERVQLVNNPKSGVASARNLGAKLARANLLIFMDDDMLITKSNILDILNTNAKFPNSCINLNWIYPTETINKIKEKQFGRYLIHFGYTTLKGWYNNASWKDNEIFESYGITSQFLLIPKNKFIEVGGYDETFPHAGSEDSDLSKRIVKMGIKIYINPLSMMYHNESDRMDIKPWLERKKRGGQTRKIAADKGYKDLEITYSPIKSLTYKVLVPMKNIFGVALKLIPNNKRFDFLYFKITNVLLGINYFEGYHKKTN